MKMEAVAQRPSLLSRPLGVGLAIFAVIIVWSLQPVGHLMVVLLTILALLFLSLKRPVWAMAALLVSQLTFPSHMVDTPFGITISLRLLLLLLIGLIIWRFRKQVELGPHAKRVIIPALIWLVISVISNVVHSDFDYAFKGFRNMIVGLLIIIYLMAVTRNLKDLKILCGVAFIGITASAVIGVLQHYQFLGADVIARVSGITESKLELMLVLPVAILTVLGILLSRGLKNMVPLLLVSAVIMGLALYFTYTRSALLALILGVMALVTLLLSRIRGEIILIIVLIGVGFIEVSGVMSDQYLGGRDIAGQQESSVARKVLWQAGLAIAMDNPILGIGGDQYRTVAPQYASSVDPALLRWEEKRYWGYRTLGSEEPHNDFLAVSISAGIVALVAYLWLLMAAMRNVFDSYRRSDKRFIKGLSIGLAAGLISYGVNVFYHNGLATLPLLWMLVGFSAAIAKVAAGKQKQKAINKYGS
jgi:O-antigen ligase